MESEIGDVRLKQFWVFILSLLLGIGYPATGYNQERSIGGQSEKKAEIRLRKAVKTRQYRGDSIQGEERVIAPGDTLWSILIREKGLAETNFRSYLILLRSLNPQVKNPDILRIGDIIFIPIRPDEILGIEIPSGKGGPNVYRVKRGDYLFKILREQRGLQELGDVLGAFNQVKKINPHRENWNLIFAGEAILLPPLIKGGPPEVVLKSPREFIGLDYGLKIPVKENLNILQDVVGVVGNEMTSKGEEKLALKEGTIHLDRSRFPIIQNSRSGKKVVLNLDEVIAPSILTQIESENQGITVVSGKKGSSVHEVANNLFSHLGFQNLPSDRPVELHDKGIGLKVKGEWMVTNPEERGGRQEMWIISLTDGSDPTPDYLREYLSLKGMNMNEILLPSSAKSPAVPSRGRKIQQAESKVLTWPRDKKALVDAFLNTYRIPFSKHRKMALSLRQGIRLETNIDRFFKLGGRKFGIFFRDVGDEVVRALKERVDITPIVLDIGSLSSRQILSFIFAGLGEGSTYQEHRFPVAEGRPDDKLVLTVSGFFLPNRSLLLTDRAIPGDLQRFFFEKGLRVIYF